VTKQIGMWCGEHQSVKIVPVEGEKPVRKKREPATPT
jgi:hypothetical protein